MESPDTPWARTIDGRVKKRIVPKPSRAALFFLEFLRSNRISGGRLVDIGCGNGRNAVLFAQEGFEVHAVDRSDEVLKDLDLHGVMPHCHSVTDYWLFEDGFFDLAIDILCFYGQGEGNRKKTYLSELRRVLRPGGYLLLSVPSDYGQERVEEEFSGFELISREIADDTMLGKKLDVLNAIFRRSI